MFQKYGYKGLSVKEGEADEDKQFRFYLSLPNTDINQSRRYLFEGDKQEQYVNHKDFVITKTNGVSKTIDAKSRKRFRGNYVNDAVLVEIRSNTGGKGWLYGKMDYVSFNVDNVLYLCEMNALRKHIESLNLDYDNPITDNKELIYNKPYQRRKYGNKDITIWLPIQELPCVGVYKEYAKFI